MKGAANYDLSLDPARNRKKRKRPKIKTPCYYFCPLPSENATNSLTSPV